MRPVPCGETDHTIEDEVVEEDTGVTGVRGRDNVGLWTDGSKLRRQPERGVLIFGVVDDEDLRTGHLVRVDAREDGPQRRVPGLETMTKPATRTREESQPVAEDVKGVVDVEGRCDEDDRIGSLFTEGEPHHHAGEGVADDRGRLTQLADEHTNCVSRLLDVGHLATGVSRQLGNDDPVSGIGQGTSQSGHLCRTAAPTVKRQDERAGAHLEPGDVADPEGLEVGCGLLVTGNRPGTDRRRGQPRPEREGGHNADREGDSHGRPSVRSAMTSLDRTENNSENGLVALIVLARR